MTRFLFHFFNILLEICCLLLSPLILIFIGIRRYWGALNFKATDSEKGIMIHSASVGEVNAVRPLVKALQEKYPRLKIVMTCTTLSGLEQAKTLHIPAYLSVLDLPWLRKKQLQSINPQIIIIVETEIWPNLLYQAKKQGIKIAFVNARLSEKSFNRFKKWKKLLHFLEEPIKIIMAQTQEDTVRFRNLFTVPVLYVGNLKFALQLPQYDELELRMKYGYKPEDFIICFGSSRPGEEALLKNILPELKLRIPELKLVIAIRHPYRIGEVRDLFPEAAIYSELQENVNDSADVLLIDIIGHLNEFYAICDLAIVGGSFFDFGGHNPLEPAFYGKPIIMGPYHSSCAGSVQELLSFNAILISDSQNLKRDIIYLYQNPEKRKEMGENARACIERNKNALENHLRGLEPWITA
ncbi:MAG TPA: glycosyltransferase N-terminal domain-containing protein [Candidatus Syntrophosphaera thermopropionivorans]|nr:glycosyltransferase N-terminal domain-containing protein [Candidatus Syntrophosphaera thermopropionivorans]